MRIEHLAFFCEVANSKSINKAAKNLFIAQPALTSVLNALEEELGFSLLTRSRHGVVLTPSDKRLLADLNLAMYPEKDDVISALLFKQYFIYGTHFHLSNLKNILSIVANNKAVSTMPGKILSRKPYVLNGQIKIMEIIDYPQPLNYYILYRKKNMYSEIYQDIVRLTKKVFLQEIQCS